MSLDASTTEPTHWGYIAEGGSSIVFSYAGPPNNSFTGTVLRLRKVLNESLSLDPAARDATHEPDDPSIVFQHQVIQRLIAAESLPRLESVTVNREWLQQLYDLNQAKRPLERRIKDSIDLSRTKAVLATDLVGGEGLAVEIKVRFHLSLRRRESLSGRLMSNFTFSLAEMGLLTLTYPPFIGHKKYQIDHMSILHACTSQVDQRRGSCARVLPA